MPRPSGPERRRPSARLERLEVSTSSLLVRSMKSESGRPVQERIDLADILDVIPRQTGSLLRCFRDVGTIDIRTIHRTVRLHRIKHPRRVAKMILRSAVRRTSHLRPCLIQTPPLISD